MKKCWIISEYAYPVVVTTGYYVTEIAEYIASKGLEVGVITTNMNIIMALSISGL